MGINNNPGMEGTKLIKLYGKAGILLLRRLHWAINVEGGYFSQIIHNDITFICHSREEWSKRLKIPVITIRRTIEKLIKDNLIKLIKDKHRSNIRSFTLNYDVLTKLLYNFFPKDMSLNEVFNELYRSILKIDRIKKNKQPNSSRKPKKTYNVSSISRTNADWLNFETPKTSISRTNADWLINSVHKPQKTGIVHFENAKMSQPYIEDIFIYNKSKQVGKNSRKSIRGSRLTFTDDEETLPTQSNSIPFTAKTTIAQDVLDMSKSELGTNDIMSKSLARFLVAAHQKKFDSNLEEWRRHFALIKTSSFLMGPKFNLSLKWLINFSTIDAIRAGKYSVKPDLVAIPLGENKIIAAIPKLKEALGEDIGWFYNATLNESNQLVAPNTFTKNYWESNFKEKLATLGIYLED